MAMTRYYGTVTFSGGNDEHNRITKEMTFGVAADWWISVTQYFRNEKNYADVNWSTVEVSIFEIINAEESREVTSEIIVA
jgi:hypothetical protein